MPNLILFYHHMNYDNIKDWLIAVFGTLSFLGLTALFLLLLLIPFAASGVIINTSEGTRSLIGLTLTALIIYDAFSDRKGKGKD